MKKTLVLVSTVVFVLFLTVMISSYPSNNPTKYVSQNYFDEQKLISYLKELNLKYPHIVLAQAKLETSNFTSSIFKSNNNLFGMKQAKQRATTCKGTKNNHAIYDSWKESVIDYALYSSRYLSRVSSEKEYLLCLKKTYAEDPHYVSKLERIIKRENLKKLF